MQSGQCNPPPLHKPPTSKPPTRRSGGSSIKHTVPQRTGCLRTVSRQVDPEHSQAALAGYDLRVHQEPNRHNLVGDGVHGREYDALVVLKRPCGVDIRAAARSLDGERPAARPVELDKLPARGLSRTTGTIKWGRCTRSQPRNSKRYRVRPYWR